MPSGGNALKGITPSSTINICVGGTAGYAGAQTGYMAWHGFFATEASAQFKIHACMITNVNIQISTNTLNSTSTFTLMVNGSPSAITFTVGAGVTGWVGGTGAITVNEGDLIDLKIVLGGTGAQGLYFKGGGVYSVI